MPGRRPVGVGIAAELGVGNRREDGRDEVVAQGAEPGGRRGLVLRRELGRDGEGGDGGGVEGAGPHAALLAAAVQHGTRSRPRRATSAPAPIGPPTLWALSVRQSTVLAARSSGSWPRACTASLCTGMPCSCASAASSSIGWTVPTSLLAHSTVTRATLAGVALDARPCGRDVDPPELVDRQPLDLGALGGRQPLDGVEHGVVLDGAGEHPAPARVLVAAGPEQALDGEVVGLGAAGREHHLARPRADSGGELLARLLDDPAGAAGRSCAATTALPARASSAVMASIASGSIGVVAAWSR